MKTRTVSNILAIILSVFMSAICLILAAAEPLQYYILGVLLLITLGIVVLKKCQTIDKER